MTVPEIPAEPLRQVEESAAVGLVRGLVRGRGRGRGLGLGRRFR